jgi:hypothetical protein
MQGVGREGGGKKLRGTGVLAKLAVLLPERWLSGLRRTPGKREYLKSTVGSNPSLSASSNLRIAAKGAVREINTRRVPLDSLHLTTVGSGLFFPHGSCTRFFENGQ